MTLIEKLLEKGYPKEEIYHHESDLYIFVTPMPQKVVSEWFKEQNLNKGLFVSVFKDQITGKPMYDCAFQYYSFEGNKGG